MMAIKTRMVLAVALAAAVFTATGCATVQPWQRGLLADSCMIFDANSTTAYMTHWQESREGSMGGFGVQGGGCGCK